MPDLHSVCDAPTEQELEQMDARMRAYIFPNVPQTQEEKFAFHKALVFQIAHEKTLAEKMPGTDMPAGTTGFSIGDFSMSFADSAFDGRLTQRTICPSARGALLIAGLLYKGVEGRRPPDGPHRMPVP